MKWKQEAATLLKHSGTFYRVVHLIRTVPPRQIEAFIREFDSTIRGAYEDLLGSHMGDNTWKIAKLPPKYGGMGWRTGLQTYGAQYITSVAKTADDVERIIPGYNPTELVMRNANEWLMNHAGPAHDAATALRTIRTTPDKKLPQEPGDRLSLGQKCEEWLWFDTRKGLHETDLLHILAHSGPGHHWVTAPPLVYNSWNMTPPEWTAATRRRLGIDVFPAETQCTFCRWNRLDVKGNHTSRYEGGHPGS